MAKLSRKVDLVSVVPSKVPGKYTRLSLVSLIILVPARVLRLGLIPNPTALAVKVNFMAVLVVNYVSKTYLKIPLGRSLPKDMSRVTLSLSEVMVGFPLTE